MDADMLAASEVKEWSKEQIIAWAWDLPHLQAAKALKPVVTAIHEHGVNGAKLLDLVFSEEAADPEDDEEDYECEFCTTFHGSYEEVCQHELTCPCNSAAVAITRASDSVATAEELPALLRESLRESLTELIESLADVPEEPEPHGHQEPVDEDDAELATRKRRKNKVKKKQASTEDSWEKGELKLSKQRERFLVSKMPGATRRKAEARWLVTLPYIILYMDLLSHIMDLLRRRLLLMMMM